MVKKKYARHMLAASLIIIICTACVTVCAQSLREATASAAEYFGIKPSENYSFLRKFRNYRSISEEDKPLASAAAHEGLLLPENGVLDMDSDDITPLLNGIISYGIKSGKYKLVTDVFKNGEIARAPVTDDTFALCGTPVTDKEYTALISRENKCEIVFEPTAVRLPTLLRCKVYYAADGVIAFSEAARFSLGYMIDIDLKGRLMFGTADGIDEDYVNKSCLDTYIYVFADYYDAENIKIYGMRKE